MVLIIASITIAWISNEMYENSQIKSIEDQEKRDHIYYWIAWCKYKNFLSYNFNFSGYLLFNFLSKFRNNISYLKIMIIVRTINGLISVTLVLFTIINYKTRTTFYSAISDYNVNVIGVTKRDKSASSSKFRSVNPLFLKNLLKHEGHRSDIVNWPPAFMPSYFISKCFGIFWDITFMSKLILFSIFSIPYYDQQITGKMLGGNFSYTLDGVIMIIWFHRLIFLWNFWMVFNKWSHVNYQKTAQKLGVKLSLSFWLKLELKHNLFNFK